MEKVEDLCLDCGHCCNGNIFPELTVEKEKWKYFNNLKPVFNPSKNIDFSKSKMAMQSCQNLDSCNLCTIYENRPNVCKEYFCGLILSVRRNKLTTDDAKDLIKQLRKDPTNKDILNKFKDRTISSESNIPLEEMKKRFPNLFKNNKTQYLKF